jgi:hypothetical protein
LLAAGFSGNIYNLSTEIYRNIEVSYGFLKMFPSDIVIMGMVWGSMRIMDSLFP